MSAYNRGIWSESCVPLFKLSFVWCTFLLWWGGAVLPAFAGGLNNFDVLTVDSVSSIYDPFSGAPSVETLRFEFRRNSDKGDGNGQRQDTFNLKFRQPEGGGFTLRSNSGAMVLPFDIVSLGAGSFIQSEGEYVHFINYSDSSPDTMEYEYELSVPASQWALPGVYEAVMEVVLVNSSDAEDVAYSAAVKLSVLVQAKLQMNLAGQLGRFDEGLEIATVDFGELETGESKKIFIQVRGNADAAIVLTSENKGKMVHSRNKAWMVDYTVRVDGEVGDLAAPLFVERPVANDFRGSAYPLEVIIGDVPGSFAGKYQDVITIDVSPL